MRLLSVKRIFNVPSQKKVIAYGFLMFLGSFLLLVPFSGFSQGKKDTIAVKRTTKPQFFSHQIGVDFSYGKLISPKFFFEEDSENNNQVTKGTNAFHLKYSFSLSPETLGNRVYTHTYQGIGMGYQKFEADRLVGNPFLIYLFQHSRLLGLGSKASLDYEWNFGVATGWKPYHPEKNPSNIIIGSKVNAYINLGVYLNWELGEHWSFSGGAELTHFSNGNTQYPNAGLNAAGVRAGAVYAVSPPKENWKTRPVIKNRPKFPKHWSYDLVLFGSWRKKGVYFSGERVASPYQYAVFGGYLAPLYNFTYRLRAGLSLDALYDGSANVYTEDYISGTKQPFYKPALAKQIALGTSIRGEYVMPIFTISMGVGTHVLHGGGDLKGTYQSLALKVRTTQDTFLHIGYNLKDFKEPNYLMLGLGYRFNNKTPSLLRD